MDAQDQRRFGAAGILRLTGWATAATVALTFATLAALSPTGSDRIAATLKSLGGGEPQQNMQLAARKAELETDRRSMNDALRLLAADRDRLLSRVASLERNLDDITGSIKSQVPRPPPDLSREPPSFDQLPQIPTTEASPARTESSSPPESKLPNVWPRASLANTAIVMPGAFDGAPAWPAPPARVAVVTPADQPMAPTVVSRTEFGVDIGSGSDLAEVRSLWNAAKSQHGNLVGNLRPVVLRREDRAGNTDYRLVIGPLANAAAAAKLCATLGAADIMCSTRPYVGERLAP